MRLYIAIVESWRKKGRLVKLAVHTSSKKRATLMVRQRYTKWILRGVYHQTGPKCIAFQDEFPD